MEYDVLYCMPWASSLQQSRAGAVVSLGMGRLVEMECSQELEMGIIDRTVFCRPITGLRSISLR